MTTKIPMPMEIAEVYNKLTSEVTWLHGRWICYRQLFAHSPKRVELLNETASTFFLIIQDVLLDEVQITLSKLTDPAKSGSNENLSLKQLQIRLETSADIALVEVCNNILEQLQIQCEPFRTRRNKKLAHIDLAIALQTSLQPLPEVSRQTIEDALKHVRAYLNTIEMHYNNSEWGYEHFIMNSDGDALIANLRSGLRYEELLQDRKLPYEDWRHGKWHDA